MSGTIEATMTADEFAEWCRQPSNTSRRCELVAGEVVDMPPTGERHGTLLIWIGHLLLNYVIARGAGQVTAESGLVIEQDPGTVRGPDLMVFADGRPFEQLSRQHSLRVPSLVVEILSPSDRWGEMNRKVQQYHRRGVTMVWVVDPEDRLVTVHRIGEWTQTVGETEVLSGEPMLPALSVPVATIFNPPGGQGPAS